MLEDAGKSELDTVVAARSAPPLEEEVVPVLADYLASSSTIHLIVALRDGTIRLANGAMAEALGVPESELLGRSLWELMTEPDAASLRERVGWEAPPFADRFLLNFVNVRSMPFTLECGCAVRRDHFLLVGEPPPDRVEAFQEEWLRMNNQLAVLAREYARQNKELRQTREELEKALTHLRDSHWHLKKIQDVLPLCMGCGKVRSGPDWEGVVEYLKKNAEFLSHGYCPECLARVATEWGLPPGALPS